MHLRDHCTWKQCVVGDIEREELPDMVDSSSVEGLGLRVDVTPASESDPDNDCDQCMPCYGLLKGVPASCDTDLVAASPGRYSEYGCQVRPLP